eukprot:5853554-Pleurochrysis_carterae.AAC.3
MPSRSIPFHSACTLAAFVPASHVYLVRPRPLRFQFPVNPERMADVALCALDWRPPSGAFSPRA